MDLPSAGKGGKVSDPAGASSKKVVMQSPSLVPGAKRVKLRYGPYSSISPRWLRNWQVVDSGQYQT